MPAIPPESTPFPAEGVARQTKKKPIRFGLSFKLNVELPTSIPGAGEKKISGVTARMIFQFPRFFPG